jgi:hypothetical protein
MTALSIAALGIALNLSLPATTTPASGANAGTLELDPPAAPSNCRSRTIRAGGKIFYDQTEVTWRDNSTNEDGFIFETWRRQSGAWIPAGSFSLPADSTSVMFPAELGQASSSG